MPINGSGTYVPPTGSEQPDPPTAASLSAFRTWQDDLSDAITACLKADGSTPLTARMLFDDGAVSAPGIAYAQDTDTGFYNPGSGQIGVASNGVNVATFKPAGLVLNASDLILAAESTIASATTTSIGAIASNAMTVSGTVTITSLGTGTEGQFKLLRFAGILTFTNGASLLLPGSADITTAANDVAFVRCEATNVWRCLAYWRKTGIPIGAGTMVTQNASNVTITGGSVTGITDLAVADGGTGSSTAAAARAALGIVTYDTYTGTTGGNLDFPVGTFLLVDDSADTHPSHSSVVVVSLLSTYAYEIGGGGGTLTGTWHARGGIPTTPSSLLVERVA